MFAVAIAIVAAQVAAAQQAKNAQQVAGQAIGVVPWPAAQPIHGQPNACGHADPVEPAPVSVKPSRQLTD